MRDNDCMEYERPDGESPLAKNCTTCANASCELKEATKKRYVVRLVERWVYTMAVEADSVEEAKSVAEDRWNGSCDENGHEIERPISVTHHGEQDGDGWVECDGDEARDTMYYSCLPLVGSDGHDKDWD